MYYLDIDSFKNRWIDKNSKKKNLPKLMDEIYYEENGSTNRECWTQAAFGFNNLGIHFDSKHILALPIQGLNYTVLWNTQ